LQVKQQTTITFFLILLSKNNKLFHRAWLQVMSGRMLTILTVYITFPQPSFYS